MDRPKRIRVVVVSGAALLALFVAFFAAPLTAVLFWPTPKLSDDIEAFNESFTQAAQSIRVANTVSMIALVVAGICILYLLFALAGWFIGPKEDGSQTTT
jgi:hypothetical protein